jgi:hypothetical protein
LSAANVTILAGARGPRQNELATLFKHGGFSGHSQSVLGVLYRAQSKENDAMQTGMHLLCLLLIALIIIFSEMAESLRELRDTIMSCINTDIKLPVGTSLIERHNFFRHLAWRAHVFPFELLGDTESRNQVVY